MYADQCGEFVCGSWGLLKGFLVNKLVALISHLRNCGVD